MSKLEVRNLKALAERIPDGGIYAPNLYLGHLEAEVYSSVLTRFWNKERYPGVFNRLERIKRFHRLLQDGEVNYRTFDEEPETKFGFFESGVKMATEVFSASAFAAVVRGFHTLDLSIIVFDSEEERYLSYQTVFGVNDVFQDIQVSTSLGRDLGRLVVFLQGSWDPRDGSEPRAIFSKLTHGAGLLQAEKPTVTHPVRRSNAPADPGAVTIGLGRAYMDQGPNSTMDYAWNQPQVASPRGMIPFVGQARFPRAIRPLVPKSNFAVHVSVVNTFGGGGYFPISPQSLDDVYRGFHVDAADPSLLKWEFLPGNTTVDPGTPIVFDQINWPSDMRAIFFFKALVVLDNGMPAQITVRSFDGVPGNTPDGHLSILPINFVWHCLSKGTRILMGDGSDKPIEDVVAGDTVRTGEFQHSEVLWTTRGAHTGTVYIVDIDSGEHIIATENHVFVAETGLKFASELRRGDKLYTNPGSENKKLAPLSTIVKVSAVDGYQGEMFNIALGDDNMSLSPGVYFANTFCVGDIKTAKNLTDSRKGDIDYLKSIIPYVHHTDIESYFCDFR